MVKQISQDQIANTWQSQGSSWGQADSKPVCVCVCVSHPTPLPSLLWGHGGQRECWHCIDVQRPVETGLKNTSHALTIYTDFKHALEEPESELPPLFWNKGSNPLSFLHNRDLYKWWHFGPSIAKETRTITGPSIISLCREGGHISSKKIPEILELDCFPSNLLLGRINVSVVLVPSERILKMIMHLQGGRENPLSLLTHFTQ